MTSTDRPNKFQDLDYQERKLIRHVYTQIWNLETLCICPVEYVHNYASGMRSLVAHIHVLHTNHKITNGLYKFGQPVSSVFFFNISHSNVHCQHSSWWDLNWAIRSPWTFTGLGIRSPQDCLSFLFLVRPGNQKDHMNYIKKTVITQMKQRFHLLHNAKWLGEGQ